MLEPASDVEGVVCGGLVGSADPSAGTESPPPAAKKKRGFWSRIFGKDKDADRDEVRDAAPLKKKSGG